MPDEGFNKRLILANGMILENCDCGFFDKGLYCFLYDIPFADVFQYFSDSSMFRTIIFELQYIDFIDRITYTGLEEVISIVRARDSIDVHLEGYRVEEKKERVRIEQNEGGE